MGGLSHSLPPSRVKQMSPHMISRASAQPVVPVVAGRYNPIKTMKTSFIGTMNMLGLAKRTKARFLLTSTSEVYGDPLVHPQVRPTTRASSWPCAVQEALRAATHMCLAGQSFHSALLLVLQVETYFGNVNCNGERSCYDEGKRAAETLTFDYMREHGLEVITGPPLLLQAATSSHRLLMKGSL